MVLHPRDHEGAALGDQAAVAKSLFSQAFDGEPVDAAMDGHEGYAVGQLALDELKEILAVELIGIMIFPRRLGKGLVERHRTHRQAAAGQDLAPHPVEIAAGGELHQRIRPFFLGRPGLAQFQFDHRRCPTRCRSRR